jgi:hypothetical protein
MPVARADGEQGDARNGNVPLSFLLRIRQRTPAEDRQGDQVSSRLPH